MKGKIFLKGKKVVLRPLSVKDAPRFSQWLADTELTKFLSVYDDQPPDVSAERQWLKKARADKNNLRLSIDTVAGKHIGIISLQKIKNRNRRAIFGIFIGDKKHWGQGCGTEACRLIVDYGFR